MAFLAPLFLFGLAALAVPVLVHLTHRQRREPVAFPSLMFLRKIEFRTTRRQRIRHWMLFALRSMALLLLVLAFARPFLHSGDAAARAGANAGREVVILLDDSFSMGYGDRWARARAAALGAIDALGTGDRASVVRFDARAAALTQPTSDRGALRAAVETLRPGAGATRYAPALSLARSIVGRAERPRREVLLISDFQRGGWTPGEELRLSDGATLRVVDVGDGPSANVVVTDIDFVRAPGNGAGRAQVTATARLANRGGGAAESVPVSLTLDGREVGRQTVRIESDAAASVRFGPFAIPEAVARGEVAAGTDALPGDNVRYFTLERGAALGVLIIQDDAAPPSRALYLRRALMLGSDPGFGVELRRGEASAADLRAAAVVILDDAPPPRGESLRRLMDFLREGGGLVVTTGERTRPDDWSGDARALLPARVGETVDRMSERGGRLGTLDRSHPVLEPFAAPRSGNFSAARFYRYRPLAPSDSAAVIARWDDGSAALAERRLGRGRVLLWGSTFDNVWNDLPLQPVFLPFVHQLVRHAAGWTPARPWRTVGDALDGASLAPGAPAADSATAEYVALSPAGARARLTGRGTLELDAPGVWEIRRFGVRNAPARLVAVNVDPRESDLSRVPPAEVIAAVAPADSGVVAGSDGESLTASERESRQSLWWFLLLGATLLLVGETVVGNLGPRVSGLGPRRG